MLIDETFGRKWKVELSPFKDGRIFVGQGWTAFKNEYKLEEGQEYKFTFIENEDNLVLVQKSWVVIVGHWVTLDNRRNTYGDLFVYANVIWDLI